MFFLFAFLLGYYASLTWKVRFNSLLSFSPFSLETAGLIFDSDHSPSRRLQVQLGTKLNSQKAHLHLHPWNSNSNCDVIFDSCVPPKVCKIQSPNFPGFYLRNVTCNYWFKESNVPSGYKGYYIIQSKVSVFSFLPSPLIIFFVCVCFTLILP